MSNTTDDGKGDNDPCPLQYFDFKMVDHKAMCPFFTSLLTRSTEQGIAPEDLHLLQSDLETLLAGANRRIRQIDSEMKLLIDWVEKKDKKSVRQRELEILNSLSSFKRSRSAAEEKGAKRQKFEESRSASPAPVGRPKSKHSASSEGSQEEETFSPSVKAKSDAPNRFWTAVEPYCADITLEDQKFLEESLKVPDDEQEYYKIPPLGKHYAEKWAQEDLLIEQEEGARMQDKKLRGTLTNATSENTGKTSEEKSTLKKGDSSALPEEDLCPFGPLTQRLVSALIEENIIAPISEQSSSVSGNSDNVTTTRSGNNPPRTPTKAPHVPHTRTLEARIREELVFQGLIDADDQTDEENDDEVLSELKRHQNELRALIAKNRQQKMELLKLTQEEMKRQELKHRAQVADAEVMEWFRKMMACKQKRKSPTKKEKEAAWKALREREAIQRVLGNT